MTAALDRVGQQSRAPIAERRADVINMQGQFALALGDQRTAERFVRVALTALNRPPAYPGASTLGDCTRESLLGGLITCAQLRLEPNDPRGLAYLIPYRNNREGTVEAQLQLGYRGLIDLAHRSGQIKVLAAETVHSNDDFTENRWPRELKHRAADGDRGDAVRYYAAVAYKDGGEDFVTMTVAEVEAWRERYSKGWKKRDGKPDPNSPWVNNFDEMAKKTCLRRLAKTMPLSVEDLRVGLAVDGSVQTSLSPSTPDVLLAATPIAEIEGRSVEARPPQVNEQGVIDGALDDTGGADPTSDEAWPKTPAPGSGGTS